MLPGHEIAIQYFKSRISRVPTFLVKQNCMNFPGNFQLKAMKSQINLALNQCGDKVDRYDKYIIDFYFVNDTLKSES